MCDAVEFRLLKYIAAIAETAIFTRAAEQWLVAQPSHSMQIKGREDRIVFPIFVRNRDGVRSTSAGELIVLYTQEMVKTCNELRVGFSFFVDPNLVQFLSEIYAKLFFGCPIQCARGEPAQVLQWMGMGRLEAAIPPLPVDCDGLVVELVASARLVVCVKSDDAPAERTEITTMDRMDLANRLMIFRTPNPSSRLCKRVIEMLAEAGFDLHVFALRCEGMKLFKRC